MADWKELFTGTDLSGWSGRDGAEHTWGVAGDVALDETDPALFTVKPGTGVFYNGATGRTADLISTISHGDCEMHIEFVVPKGSNSGVYVMGRYEIQVFDSWGATDLKYSACGAMVVSARLPLTVPGSGKSNSSNKS